MLAAQDDSKVPARTRPTLPGLAIAHSLYSPTALTVLAGGLRTTGQPPKAGVPGGLCGRERAECVERDRREALLLDDANLQRERCAQNKAGALGRERADAEREPYVEACWVVGRQHTCRWFVTTAKYDI